MGVAWIDGDWTDFPDGEIRYGNLDELGPEWVEETPERFKARLPSGALVSPGPSDTYGDDV